MAIGVNARTASRLPFRRSSMSSAGNAAWSPACSLSGLISALIRPVRRLRMVDLKRPAAGRRVGVVLLVAGFRLRPSARAMATLSDPWHPGGEGREFLGYARIAFLPNWFVRRRGLAIGIAFSGVGVGSIVLLPWLQIADRARRLALACWRSRCSALVLLFPLNLLLRKRPAGHRPRPDGDPAPTPASGTRGGNSSTPRGPRPNGRSPARCAPARFWWIALGYFSTSTRGTPYRCTRPNTSSRSASRRRRPRGRSGRQPRGRPGPDHLRRPVGPHRPRMGVDDRLRSASSSPSRR